ncbi:ATP-dependent Clp protease ATP-binding subunit [Nocardioides immobilis]|uniref:ATP-dependent Clp protease ATP-binding subunit n=1 Tax=Nocardioides immobilis TaxID=2049295 RepID=A0A417XYH2_9ACTN|nr:AAA family ATPase [Nocardioides immobilis]RHW25418.1 ATP-dependent Clp protease ATP-binding subunit [Nocardioides immobilis]
MTPEERREVLGRFPHWLRDVDAHLPICAQFILHGNVRDDHLVPDGEHHRFRRTVDAIDALLTLNTFEAVLTYDPVAGLRANEPETAQRALHDLSGDETWSAPDGQLLSIERLTELVRVVQPTIQPKRRIALIVDYVSQFAPTGEPLSEAHHALFRTALQRVHNTQRTSGAAIGRAPLFNPVLWIVDRPSDLPGWMVGTSDGIHQVPIPLPTLDARSQAAGQIAVGLAQQPAPPGPMSGEELSIFATRTEGMTLRSMREVVRLAQDQRISSGDIDDAVRMYRVGLLENPWSQASLKDKIRTAEDYMRGRVLGQPSAIRRSLDILMRSTTGMTAAHAGGTAAGPRGVLFFAGPTGVGKTELAKTLTEVIFGNADAYIRFDMSEFGHEGSDLRLMGAPPGYVGHEAGGELTNAIRQRPFSLVLFDEIEKADQRIMDKFLQILSDGRLTDGSGATVHFSESLIVFTSNKGMADPLPSGELPHPDMTYDDLDDHVRRAIGRHFTEHLGRPEILNRIGDNIVVFDYIRPDIAAHLLEVFVRNAIRRAKTLHGIDVRLSEKAMAVLAEQCCAHLEMGGRGIGQRVESVLTNPLARAVFFHDDPNRPIQVDDIVQEEGAWNLVVR